MICKLCGVNIIYIPVINDTDATNIAMVTAMLDHMSQNHKSELPNMALDQRILPQFFSNVQLLSFFVPESPEDSGVKYLEQTYGGVLKILEKYMKDRAEIKLLDLSKGNVTINLVKL